MQLLLKRVNQVYLVLILRSVAIAIQLILILFVNLVLAYQLPWTPLFSIIIAELLFTIASYFYYRRSGFLVKNVASQVSTHNERAAPDKIALLLQICADILFLSLLLYFSGGATNAFVSLLLIPIAIAAVTLTPVFLALVAGLAIAAYSVLLWLMPMSVMHGNMEGHFIGMWINFLFSTSVVAFVVGKMARTINQRELAIASYRENLLKQEQVIAIGVASAQVTHQLATPIATVQLLADELSEDFPTNAAIIDMQSELKRCKESLQSFRQMTFNIKEQVIEQVYCLEVIKQISDHMALNYPDITFKIINKDNNKSLIKHEEAKVLADGALLPAILNLLNNAVRATKASGSKSIELTSQIIENNWQMIIRDFGAGFTLSKLAELGIKPVSSEQGLGMAVFLSHASLERLGGKLALTNHQEGGALVTLSLPLENKR